ncbi:cytochrome P450 [Hyaloraphidium curvatum]|nr:cytochrome P450 [Hyaloraphidium curvatum]
MSLAVTLVLSAAVLLLLAELYRRVFLSQGDSDAVATVFALPFVNRPDLKRVDQVFLVDEEFLRRTGKKIVRFVDPFKPWKRMLLVADPVVLRDVFVGPKWEAWNRGAPAFAPHDPYAGGLIFMPNGQEWRDARAIFDRTFTTPAVRGYVPILNDLRDTFMGEIARAQKESSDGFFDVQPYLMRFTFDTICRLSFGEDLKAQTTRDGRALLTAWEKWFQASNVLVLLNLLFWDSAWEKLGGPLLKQWKAGRDVIYGLIERGLERRRRGEDLDRVSIMDNALRNEKLPGFMKDDASFKKHIATMLFAGHDTTAGTLALAIHFLGQNPAWQQSIREEVLAACGPSAPISLEQLENLPALAAVVKETLRMFPIAPSGGGRYMTEDLEYTYTDGVDGREKRVSFQRGDIVLPFVFGAQRHPDFWKQDPRVWNPQRWIDDANGGARNLYAYAPFGNGARRCVGERLALGETKLILASMLRRGRIVPGDYVFEPKSDATISAKYGVVIRLEPLA